MDSWRPAVRASIAILIRRRQAYLTMRGSLRRRPHRCAEIFFGSHPRHSQLPQLQFHYTRCYSFGVIVYLTTLNMETKDQEDVEKAVPSGSHQATSDDADTTEMNSSNTEREARPSAERVPSMRDIISTKRKRAQIFGNFSFGKRKISAPLSVMPPKLRNLQLGADEGLQLGAHEASLELLHRYNILSMRSKLLLHLRTDVALMDKDISEKIFQDLSRYCRFRYR